MNAWTEQDSLDLTVALVVEDGRPMPLVGAERRAAVEQMIAAGLDANAMADRLCISAVRFRKWAHRAGIRLPKPEAAWWVAVAHPHRELGRRRHYAARRQTGRVAA